MTSLNKYSFLLIFIVVFTISSLHSFAYENIKTRITIKTKNGYSTDKLIFGLHRDATDGLDLALDELEAPPFPPPQGEGINAGFVIYDTKQKQNIWTYMDLRPYPTSDTQTVVHKIEILQGAGDVVTLSWKALWPDIESAKLVDVITMGKLLTIDMKDSTSATITNEFINTLYLLVKYVNPLSVNDNNSSEGLNIYPTIFDEKINIEADKKYKSYMLSNILGTVCYGNMPEVGALELPASNISDGMYFVTLSDDKGNRISKKIIKLHR